MGNNGHFAAMLRRYMEEQGITQYEMARRLRVGQGVVSKLAHGQRPGSRTAIRFAYLAGLDPNWVLQQAGVWPEDVPLLRVHEPPRLARAERLARLLAARLDGAGWPAQEEEAQMADLVRLVSAMPDDSRNLLLGMLWLVYGKPAGNGRWPWPFMPPRARPHGPAP